MSRTSLQALGSVVLASLFLGGAAAGTVSAAQLRPVAPRAPAPTLPPAGPASPVRFDERDARETQQQLRQVLRQYPPSVEMVLRLDPSLMTREDYLAPYPTLSAFLAQHPEVARNPAFFFGQQRFDEPYNQRSGAVNAFRELTFGFMFLLGFVAAVTGLTWSIRHVIDHRRWLRLTKLQTDAHTKVLDRLTSNEDLFAYIQSPAGRTFLDSPPIPAGAGSPAIGAPIGRILWSVQAGVVIAVVGVGLWVVRNNVIEEMTGPVFVMSVLAIALGAGFVLSAFVAYALSQHLGLLESPNRHHA